MRRLNADTKLRSGLTTFALVPVIGLTLTACSGQQSALDVRGQGAERIAELWWVMLGLAAVVYFVVLLLLLLPFLFRGRRETGPQATVLDSTDAEIATQRSTRWLIAGGIILPAIILAPVFVFTLRTMSALHAPESSAGLTIQVTGRQWWWEVKYQGQTPCDEFATANEIHIPTGQRVRLEVTSADVIHSLWVPNLQGKTDLVPGRTTVTWLQAERPGISRGQCAEYCGLQHARMALVVVAESPDRFARWLAEQKLPAAPPEDAASMRGRSVFLGSGCGYCHTVRETPAPGLLGPDLTHVASRRTIAAGTLANSSANMARWIADPQHVKPGNKMPRIPLAPDDLRAVVRYLETLR